MPIVRYHIRNEYGLADPELYRAADKGDPEALLEGVAMAGLVGVLRQLGDLAEFAAEIFHNLHEEVMATAARGHALMLRVQQLEVDFPAIERDFLSPTGHSQLSYNAGIEWHPNLQIDQNLITREDMPRFILDSYEESRGPPRLFMLDKFDIAGDGACLKRYSDPSFFKMDFATSGKMEPDIQREKRSRKNKKKAPRWRNGEIPEPYITPHANPLEHAASEKAPENPPVKRVKLKTRQLNDNTNIRRSYIEHIARSQSPEHTDLSEMKTIDSAELAPAVREVIMDTSIDRPFFRERNHTRHYNKEGLGLTQKEETASDIRDSRNEKKGMLQKAIGEIERLTPNFNKADHELLFDTVCKREGDDDAESRTGSLDGYRSDDAASELDNYLDALTTMDSEFETDNETKAKPPPSFFSKDHHKMDSSINEEWPVMDSENETDNETKAKLTPNFFHKEDNKMNCNVNEERATMGSGIETDNETKDKPTPSLFSKEYKMDSNANEERELLDEHLGSHMVRESSTQSGLSNKRLSSPPNEDSLNILADSTSSHSAQRALSGMFTAPEAPADETCDINFEKKINCELLGKESSADLVPEQTMPDISTLLSELGVASSSSCISETTATQIYTGLSASPEDMQSGVTNENTSPVNTNSTKKSSICFDGEYSPPVHADLPGASEDTNVILCNPIEGYGESDKLLEDDSHNKSDEYEIPSITKVDDVNPSLISKDTEILSDALLQLWDESDLNLQIQDDPFHETQMGMVCTEEQSSEGDMTISSVSDPPQIIKATNLEITSPICIEDSPPPLTMLDKEELLGSVFQGPEVDSGGSTLPGKSPPIPPLDNSSSTFVPDNLSGPVDNSLLSNEKFECAGSLTDPEDAADLAVNKVTSPEYTCNFAENEVIASGILLPGSSFDMKVPQESYSLDQVESMQEDELPNILKVLPAVYDDNTRDSFLVNETKDSPSATGEVPAESSSPHSVTESTEADELCSATMHMENSSSNKTILEEDRVSSDSVSEQQKLEVTEASSLKDLIDLDVRLVPDTAPSQEEYVVASGPQDSVAAGNVLDSSSLSDCGELNHVHHTEQFELAPENLSPTDDSRAAISFVEVEGEKLLIPVLQNESKSIDSDVEHYLWNIETSNQTGADDHRTSKIAFLGQEEPEAVSDLGDSKSAESIHDSYENMDMKPIISVLCQEDHKMVVSPQNSRTEERLLESSGTSDIESVKRAEVNMHLVELNEGIEYPSENQVSHSKPLASCEPCQAANGDVLLSNDVITEDISPAKEVFNSQSSDESNEVSLLQKFGKLDLSGTQFEREHSHGQDENSRTSESQPSVLEAAQDSVEAVNSGKIYESDIPLANVSSQNQLETEPSSSFQSSYGILVSSAISSVSLASLQSFPGLGSSGTTMIQQQSSELPLDEDPPLPPLPPLQWRMGKLRPSSTMSNGEMTGPQSGLDSLTTLPSLDHLGGSLVMGGAAVQPVNPFLQVQMRPGDNDHFGYPTMEEERMNSFRPSVLPPAVEDKKCQDDMLSLDIQMKHLSANSSILSHVEDDQQKNESCQEVSSGEEPQLLNPLTQPLELSDVKAQHFHRVPEGESVEPPNSSVSQPTSLKGEPLHEMPILETPMIHPSNPFLSSTSTEGEHYRYGASENRMVQHLNPPDPLPTAEIAPQGFLISQEGSTQTFESLTLPAAESEMPNGRLCSLLYRPRDPLIEAVASHDKSTLRRVSEMVRPSAKPESERNTLLEQIRNKSFSLKPATVAKPNIKGPPTNLKVAAILERANAIRQAFVGSDEDDDGDSWSDS